MIQIGEKHNRLTLLEYREKGKGVFYCTCGNTKLININNVERGAVKSCGCLFREHPNHTKHGGRGTRLYNIWKTMRERCNTKTNKSYKYYGARGIKVCKEWDDFAIFKEWATTHGYEPTLTIDRIDVDGNYEPDNCRWATYKAQSRNKRNNRKLTFNGASKTMSEWSEITGIKVATIWARLHKGWSVEDALSKAVK